MKSYAQLLSEKLKKAGRDCVQSRKSEQENDKTVIAIKTQATGYSLHNTFGSSDQKCNVKILLMMK